MFLKIYFHDGQKDIDLSLPRSSPLYRTKRFRAAERSVATMSLKNMKQEQSRCPGIKITGYGGKGVTHINFWILIPYQANRLKQARYVKGRCEARWHRL